MYSGKAKNVLLIIIIVIVLAVVIAVPAIIRHARNSKVVVDTAKAVNGDIQSSIMLTAEIRAAAQQDVYAAQQLKVLEVPVQVGDRVKKGDVLLRFDVSDYEQAVDEARKSADDAKEMLDKAQADYDKAKRSGDPMAQAQLPQKEYALTQTKAAYEQAKAALRQAEARLDAFDREIYAEFDGIVTDVNIKAGAYAATVPTQPAIGVCDDKNLTAVVMASKEDSFKIAEGQKAVIHWGDRDYEAVVSKKWPVAKRAVTTGGTEALLEIHLDITGDTTGLVIGFTADAEINTASASNVVKVPAESIKKEKGQYYVYVFNGGTIERRQVTVGIQSESEVQIVSGLKAGEKVVLNPENKIKDGIRAIERNVS